MARIFDISAQLTDCIDDEPAIDAGRSSRSAYRFSHSTMDGRRIGRAVPLVSPIASPRRGQEPQDSAVASALCLRE